MLFCIMVTEASKEKQVHAKSLLNDAAVMNRNAEFRQLVAMYSVSNLAINISSWIESSVRTEWLSPIIVSSGSVSMPQIVANKLDCVLNFFHFLWRRESHSTSQLNLRKYHVADQLFTRLVDKFFSFCRISSATKNGISFLSISVGNETNDCCDGRNHDIADECITESTGGG